MLTTNTLMNAVEAALKRLYPGEPVYYDELPKDFRRPSLTLECQKAEQSDVNIGLVRRSVTWSPAMWRRTPTMTAAGRR